MIKAVIIEDEILLSEKLATMLREIAPEVSVVTTLTTVKESIEFFKNHSHVDLIFCDVQLSDGLSFEIFNEVEIKIPVIFITGFEKFIMYAFENNGIDYLIKPLSAEDLYKALQKYNKLKNHFSIQNESVSNLIQSFSPKKKSRVMVKKGIENISLKVDDIVLFYTENRIVYVYDKCGKKFFTDKTMYDLENELDDSVFFRVNRQYIVNLNFIKSFKAYDKVRIQLELNVSEINHFIIISQKTAPGFRSWISER